MTDSALDKLGRHLLKRKPSPFDDRDLPLSFYLGASTPLDAALKAVTASHAVPGSVKVWAKLATNAIEGVTPPAPPGPAPTPPSPAPGTDVVWTDAETVLDQGQTGHCVGFGGAQWGNTLPVDDKYTNDDGHKLYYECKVLDGEPKAEDGSDVRTLAKALQARGRLKTYAFAATIDEVIAFLESSGPVIFGTDWYNDMFNPTVDGLVTPTGAIAGGHCYLAIGYSKQRGRIRFLNSWSDGWGLKGQFEMSVTSAAYLLGGNGEGCAAVELN